ncbi:MAG TPA: type II secretion system F family protein [Fimbriimonadales bacterium]|nr:type II secretion system F family protein [Fimbriimonadales bacterium]
MPTKTFTYVALDKSGSRTTGVLEAPSESAARMQLQNMGLLVETLQEGKIESDKRGALSKHVVGPIIGKVSLEVLERFYSQLWSMYRAGVPLVQALDTLAASQTSGKMRHVVKDLRDFVLEGKKLSQGMEKYFEVFGPLQISLVKVGEKAGALENSFAQIRDYLRREIELRNAIKRYTFYPKIVVAFAILMPIFVNIIVSSIASARGGLAIPIFSLAGQWWFWYLVFIAGGIYIFFRWGIQYAPIKYFYDNILLALPYIGSTVHMLTMAKFSRAFSALYGGGVPIADAVVLSADACGNEVIRRKILPAARWLQEGKGIGASFEKTGAFTSIALQMTYTGERSGNIEAMMDSMAEQYEDEAAVRLQKSTQVITLAVYLLVAALVAYILIQFWTGYISKVTQAGDFE